MTADNLKREFLPRFFGLARKRVERGREISRAPTAETADELAREMHALAGEAGLLGLEGVLAAARQAELAAADLVKRPTDTSTRDRLDHAVGELDDAIRTAEKPAPPPPPPVLSLQEKFRARFVQAATTRREKIVRSMETAEPDYTTACSEFHTLGGEAAMLAMTAIAAVCRDGEDAARKKDRAALAAVLEQLEIAIFAEETP